MSNLPIQHDRQALLQHARTYSSAKNPVGESIAQVVRKVLVRGVECHGLENLVFGIPDRRTLYDVGVLLSRFLPEVRALGVNISDPQEWLTSEWMDWWDSGGPTTNVCVRKKDAALLERARAWTSVDPVGVYLEIKMNPKRRAPRRKPPAQPPYTAAELARIFAWAEQAPTFLARVKVTVSTALAFGIGLSASEIRTLNHSSISPRADTVDVGGVSLAVRPEVQRALVSGRHLGLFPFKYGAPFKDFSHPDGIRVSLSRLRLTWAVAAYADGASYEDVAARIGRHAAKHAATYIPTFGPWPTNYELSPLVNVDAVMGELGKETPVVQPARPRLRLIQGGAR